MCIHFFQFAKCVDRLIIYIDLWRVIFINIDACSSVRALTNLCLVYTRLHARVPYLRVVEQH